MAKLYNLAKMTTATTGTGTITLGSAVSGFLTFAQSGVADGDIVSYGIVDGSNREVGYGKYTSSGTTLTRNCINSTNSNSAINLSGSATVFITVAALDISIDGWLPANETWTYASSTTFTVSGVNVTEKYLKGARIRLKQGGSYKYFVVATSSFSTDTTVTITGGSDYTLANSAITDNYYSYQVNPQGYPTVFNYSPSFTGFSGSPTESATFSIVGKIVTAVYSASGTSNATTMTCVLPITVASGGVAQACYVTDNSSGKSTPGRGVAGGGTNLTFGLNMDGNGGFTASGTKACQGIYVYGI